MNCTGVASTNCSQAGSIQCEPQSMPTMGSTSGSDSAMPKATGPNPAQAETSCGGPSADSVRGS
ncbi:hypothetical protein D3C86_1767240 [compost metagenome]